MKYSSVILLFFFLYSKSNGTVYNLQLDASTSGTSNTILTCSPGDTVKFYSAYSGIHTVVVNPQGLIYSGNPTANFLVEYIIIGNETDFYAGASAGQFSGTIIINPTGISNASGKSILTIFPAPFSSSTTLNTGFSLSSATLTVANIFGQTVAKRKNISGQTIVFNRDNLASGLYFVRLTQDGSAISTDKFVITDK